MHEGERMMYGFEQRVKQGLLIYVCCCFADGIRCELIRFVFIAITGKMFILVGKQATGFWTKRKRQHLTYVRLTLSYAIHSNQPPLMVHQSQCLKYVAMATNGRAKPRSSYIHETHTILFENSECFNTIYIYK